LVLVYRLFLMVLVKQETVCGDIINILPECQRWIRQGPVLDIKV